MQQYNLINFAIISENLIFKKFLSKLRVYLIQHAQIKE